VRELISRRRKFRGTELDERALDDANLEELRRIAVSKSRSTVGRRRGSVTTRMRAIAIKNYALRRAAGRCEFCGADAPFRTKDGEPYLESHHITRLADDGPDHPAHVIGVCPNCHRRAHYSDGVARIKVQMKKRVAAIERRL
jgi:5-methylcytosine-specific restriction protein A